MKATDIKIDLPEISAELSYNEKTGLLTWATGSRGRKAGASAGGMRPDGYIELKWRGRGYMAHRIIWGMHYGQMPDDVIDHINGNRSDNRISNLRAISQRMNSENSVIDRRKTTSLPAGVARINHGAKTRQFSARITVNRKMIHLGCFVTAEEAHRAYIAAKLNNHPSSLPCVATHLSKAADQ